MENIVFTIENKYKVAYEVIDINKVGKQDFLIMILDKKMELEFKHNKEIDFNFIMNSKQLFNDLKHKYIII